MDQKPKILVDTHCGTIQGETLINSLTSEPYVSFKGVPYAEPPIGPLRFQPPQPVKIFNNILQCNEERGKSPQKILRGEGTGTEDCLYLNVFTPGIPENEKPGKPVMVYFHGGRFTFGSKSSSKHGPDFLISKGVVLVMPNFRLNVFGFLNLGIEECKGNMGLLDQKAALEWVHKNIARFGGDPNNITLFGESSGACSIHYHIMSPLSKGLFHKAILQSGNGLNPQTYMDPEVCLERAFTLGKVLGFETTSVKDLYEFLMTVPMELLRDNIYEVLIGSKVDSINPFVPSKETVGLSTNKFLPESPNSLITKAPSVPIIIGLNSREGLIAYKQNPGLTEKLIENVDRELENFLPYIIKNSLKNQDQKQKILEEIKTFYFSEGTEDEISKMHAFADFYGDFVFNRGSFNTVEMYRNLPNSKPIYTYLFTYNGGFDFLKQAVERSEFLTGSCHSDEIGYLFCFENVKDTLSDAEKKSEKAVINNITTLWTNFAKYGNPKGDLDLDWKPVTATETFHCIIDEELTVHEGLTFEQRATFWNNLCKKTLTL